MQNISGNARAFSNWFSTLAEPLSETERAHIEQYRKLASASGVKP